MKTTNFQQFMSSYSVKMIIVSGLAILLLIPSFLIREIISERIALSNKVKAELYAQWGSKQVVAGPVLNVPYVISGPDGNTREPDQRHGVARFLPETLLTGGQLLPETRKRGIYKAVVYEARLHMEGTFVQPNVAALDLQNARFNWDAAHFTIGISDMRGIKNLPALAINGQEYLVEPGVGDAGLFPSGLTVKPGQVDPDKTIHFSMDLTLVGSEGLTVEALGKTTKVTLQSSWPHPSFTGGFLPGNRHVSESGFSADWKVTHLNRNFPQQWTDLKYTTHDAALGVELLHPVDHYQKSMRSVKYAILFIALNFILFLFIEMKSKTRIHPFQYSLVAFALLLFYALLTSLGEHTGFNPAYLVSAASVTLLISWYSGAILRNARMVVWVTLLQAGLYGFLFALLQLRDHALLAGSAGLFVILAIVMRASLRIKWYPEDQPGPDQ